ncbi:MULTISPECIES: ABC-type transport auxiliary lipoprotein family protein [Ectothiorhodospira]|uniref:ABC-type transport auxiliary lipoprotein family protein n=1 Tax=Ectothiorhodospira TaxID=1051 RepID=UPI0004B21605|nr:ABC-type transport auxiliary lipoprotein family protein [Ectothiorhodospira haloalkaliphila]MCG5495442.1 ABC-type transport auxiliary lipoprotein family protein [Ectothiorhodospira variabilis]MCG5497779.1 ABC-type transport auxiliary lipoprotein family protein [Ectothiorhodospira variabilis]MCG5505040.1 ABC-type transport auxiliary lipoprotein family protein [Ectothiorhodospira variabilis]MCG5508197.1 ABC-type transport auxiliary lipoprotein family protein [Ectothiorhodospira variabilis]
MISRLFIVLVPALWLLGLAGCTLLPEQTPQRVFLLSPPEQETAYEVLHDKVLRVEKPEAPFPLTTSRILVAPSGKEISFYGGARWADRTPPLVAAYMVEALRQDGRVASVISDSSSARSQVSLVSQLGALRSEYPSQGADGPPEAFVRLDVQLMEDASRNIIASRRFQVRQPSEGEEIEAVVEAMNQAMEVLSREVVDWVVEQLAPGHRLEKGS